MSATQNARDLLLQETPLAQRVLPVTLPPTVTVPPGQLGPGNLPGGVNGSDGSQVASRLIVTDTVRTSTIYTDQLKTTQGTLIFDASGRMDNSRVKDLGLLALRNGLGAGEIGAGEFGNGVVYAGVIAASQILSGTIAADRIGANTISADKLTANSVTAGKIAANSITTDKLQADSVTADKIKGGDFEGKTFTGGVFTGTTFNGVVVNSASFVGATLNVDTLKANTYVDANILHVANTANFNGSAIIHATGLLQINGPLTGSVGSRIIQSGTTWWADLVIDGVMKAVTIKHTLRA